MGSSPSYRNRVRANGKYKLPDSEYKAICNKQDNIKKQIVEQEKLMSEIQKEISRKLTLRDEVKAELKKNEAPEGFKDLIVSYRDHFSYEETTQKLWITIRNILVSQISEEYL